MYYKLKGSSKPDSVSEKKIFFKSITGINRILTILMQHKMIFTVYLVAELYKATTSLRQIL